MKSSPCSKGLRPHQSFSKQHLSANLFPLSPSLLQAELEVEYFSGTVCRQGFGSCYRSCSPEAKFRFITCQTLSILTSSPLFFPQVLLMPIFPFPPSTSQNLYPGESSFIKRKEGEVREDLRTGSTESGWGCQAFVWSWNHSKTFASWVTSIPQLSVGISPNDEEHDHHRRGESAQAAPWGLQPKVHRSQKLES